MIDNRGEFCWQTSVEGDEDVALDLGLGSDGGAFDDAADVVVREKDRLVGDDDDVNDGIFGDVVFEERGVRVVVDSASLPLISSQ